MMRRLPFSRRLWISAVPCVLLIAGCIGPPALRQSVLTYDETISQVEQDILVLNLARISMEKPAHFTAAGSIAASFGFTTNAGVGATVPEGPDFSLWNFSWNAIASENPTFQIIPMSGEEFTKSVVDPVKDTTFAFGLFVDVDVQLLMRLMADGIEVQGRDGRFIRFIQNNPSIPEEYREFRRIAMHLSWLQRTQRLFVYLLSYYETIIDGITDRPNPGDVMNARKEGMRWRQKKDGTFTLLATVEGRVLISNYDPRTLPNSEKAALNNVAKDNAENFVTVDIRPGYPGGDFPLFAALKLRSLLGMLYFIAEGIAIHPEFHVMKDPRTLGEVESPPQTLRIDVTDPPPKSERDQVFYRGRYYAIGDSRWDRTAFTILYQTYQVKKTDVSKIPFPITIAK